MSRVRSKNTRPELIVRKYLHNEGFRYRLHVKYLPGRPDIVMKKYKTVVFVNGCFWHGHQSCSAAKLPQVRRHWWANKINRNVARQGEVVQRLENLGWRILVLWSCELTPRLHTKTLEILCKKLRSSNDNAGICNKIIG